MSGYLDIISLGLIAGVVLLVAIVIVLKNKFDNTLKTKEEELTLLRQQVLHVEQERELLRARLEEEKKSSTVVENENSVLKERVHNLNQSIDKLESQLEQSINKSDEYAKTLSSFESRVMQLETKLSHERDSNIEKLKLLEDSKEQMKLEFKELANSVLETNSQKFTLQNSENLTKMIDPIKEQFDAFKKQIDDVYIKEAKDRSMLQAEIQGIKEINHQMSKEAKNLTNALKGESKKQGVWGEMILENVLQSSGLREGFEYEREVLLEHEGDKNRYRPDVIVRLPDSREIIIDAKTSLSAYERYVSADDEHKKEHFAAEHLLSVKKHIKELSDKDYTNLKGIETLDFIFMFVPIESALLMALEYDAALFDAAFKKGVILVGPTTLMVSLRAVENTWKYEHQQRNAQEIAKRAGLLFDKFIGFVESIEKIGKQITTLQKSYDEAYGKLHIGAGSLTSQFQKLETLGAASTKSLPEHIIREAKELI